MRTKKAIIIEQKILDFCRNQNKKLKDISIYLNKNKNTVRTMYLYKMIKTGKLKRVKGYCYTTVSNLE
jgi:hypothetical protein